MVNLKPTIDYNNILIKAQLTCIVAVSASETHSKRLVCIKVSERYYIVFALKAGYFRNCFAVKGGFLKPQKPPLHTPLLV